MERHIYKYEVNIGRKQLLQTRAQWFSGNNL